MAKLSGITATSITWQEAAAPSTPASTKWVAYFKTDGLYYKDDAGVETGPLTTGSAGNTLSSTLVRRTTAQNVSGSGTFTAISFDTEDEDLSGAWAIGDPTKIIIPAGLNGRRAILYGGASFTASTSGNYRGLRIDVAGGAMTPDAYVAVADLSTALAVVTQVRTHVVTLATAAEYRLMIRIDATGIGVDNAYFGLQTVD